jgi:hypothetical protein
VTVAVVAAGLAGSVAGAQQSWAGGPAPHPLAETVTSPLPFGGIGEVRRLSDGRVLVNDPVARTLSVLDSLLTHRQVVLDSASGGRSYGSTAGRLIAFTGDSSLFVDQTTNTFLVLDPRGQVVRVIAPLPVAAYMLPPRPGAAPNHSAEVLADVLTKLAARGMEWSRALGLVFESEDDHISGWLGEWVQKKLDGTPLQRIDDSSHVMTMSPATRIVDTAAWLYCSVWTVTTNPLRLTSTAAMPSTDYWAVTTDGSVAVVRAREYRIDWVGPDGARRAGTRLPFPWHPLHDLDKPRIADSVNLARAAAYDGILAGWLRDSTAVAERRVAPFGQFAGRVQLRPTRPAVGAAGDVPDFEPPLATVRPVVIGDADNHVWIRRMAMDPAGPEDGVYDVVDHRDQIVDRVWIPATRTVVGFGPGGLVFLAAHDGGRTTLEMARVR